MSRPTGSKNKVKTHTPLIQIKVPETASIYDPVKNPKAISIILQDDGNWIGQQQRNDGTLKEVRQVSPEAVLQYLLYHDGKVE